MEVASVVESNGMEKTIAVESYGHDHGDVVGKAVIYQASLEMVRKVAFPPPCSW